MADAVVLENVTKRFAGFTAVDGLSLAVPRSCIYGFIGPNGSGKTTTMRMIMRLYLPDAGAITVLGKQGERAADDRVGYLPEERGLYKKMKVGEILRFFAGLKGRSDPQQAMRRWLERLELAAWEHKKVETLSKGMARKLQFIAAVIAEPQLVILDEPFSGLDPVASEVLREAVLDLKRQGTTVILSTHDMEVAEKMCDAIFMIYRGKKVLDGSFEAISDRYGADTVRVRLGEQGVELSALDGVEAVRDYGRFQELRLAEGTDPQALLRSLLERGTVRHFELARPTLRDIFVRIAQPEAAELAAGASPAGGGS